jgi:hypothetical protein
MIRLPAKFDVMKKTGMSSAPSAAAILAGGVLFTGPAARAAVILSEDWEGATNVFSTPTYNYSSNYTQPNPGGGLVYGKGGAGTTGAPSTNFYPGPSLSLTAGTGLSTTEIDSGSAAYDFRGQFSSYLTQGDWAELSITFKDGANAPIGSPVLLGGDVFTQAIPVAPFGNYADAKEWGTSSATGIIPNGARTIDLMLSMTKVASGTAIDGYVDNFNLSVSVIPEPGTVSLSGLAGLALLRWRKR